MLHRIGQLIVVYVITSALSYSAVAQTGRQRGATMGGLAGAVVGGIIGENNNEAGAGAAIGGVVGAVAGGILGDAADKDNAIARQRHYYQQQQRQYQHQQQVIVAQQSAITTLDVVNMCRSGLSDSLIINQINQRGFGHQLQVADIISLHQQGVSEHVINALQHAPAPGVVQAPAPRVASRPVIVEQPIIVEPPIVHERIVPAPVIIRSTPPVRYSSPRHYHYRSSRSPRTGFNIRF